VCTSIASMVRNGATNLYFKNPKIHINFAR
jgi:hypothetical protein